MTDFIPLEELRGRVWPLAAGRNLATDMTGVSLPIPDMHPEDAVHPCRAVFLLYYAVPDAKHPAAPADVTRAYARIALDMKSGDFVKAETLIPENESKPLIGPGTRREVFELPDEDRRNLQDLFFSRCNEAARIYFGGVALPTQREQLGDLSGLYENLMEPPLRPDYENTGKNFFSWLRTAAGEDLPPAANVTPAPRAYPRQT